MKRERRRAIAIGQTPKKRQQMNAGERKEEDECKTGVKKGEKMGESCSSLYARNMIKKRDS